MKHDKLTRGYVNRAAWAAARCRESTLLRRHGLPLLFLLLWLPVLVACPTTEKRAYLVLGSSYAAGAGVAKYEESYPALFHAFLQEELEEQLSLRSFALDDETTESMIAEGQLAKGLAELRFRNHDESPDNDALVITLQIGGEEVRSLLGEDGPCLPPATLDDRRCGAAFDETMDEMRLNMPVILRALRVAAGPDAALLVLNYFNPSSADGETADRMYSALNDLIAEATGLAGVDATLVNITDAFEGRTDQLTALLEDEDDRVPNEAGHALIASLLEQTRQR